LTAWDIPLRPYQLEGVQFLRQHDRAFLGDEMGLGKSCQLIRASTGRTLVVAPAMVVDSGTWSHEIEKWGDDPGRFTVASYSSLTTRRKTAGGGTAPTATLRDELAGNWDTLVLDEAHYIKNPSANRTQAVVSLSKLSDRVYMASGTPIPNWPYELFVPLQILFPAEAKAGQRLGSKWRWIREWFHTYASPYRAGGTDIGSLKGCTLDCKERDPLDPCVHYREFVKANFQGRFLQRLRDDVLTDLPPLTVDSVTLPMTPRQDREYRSMSKDYIASTDDGAVIAWSAASKSTNLDRITTGLGVLTGPDYSDSNKLDMLREDLSNRYRPTVVVAHYRHSVHAAAAVAEDLGKTVAVVCGDTPPAERKWAVTEFQAGNIDVLCGSLDVISEGLTLTAADMLIQIETSYRPSRNQQVKRRIHRIGQVRPCTVREYISVRRNGANCLDGNKRALVAEKTDTQMRTLSAARLKELL